MDHVFICKEKRYICLKIQIIMYKKRNNSHCGKQYIVF